jgi:CPA2 family monovalent cation:H+ antiporter-2
VVRLSRCLNVGRASAPGHGQPAGAPLEFGAAGLRTGRQGQRGGAGRRVPVPHETGLIAALAIALAFAFGGFIATRLRRPAIVGSLLLGVMVAPFAPGFVTGAELAPQPAEIGVRLLMFGGDIHSSVRDLPAVRAVAVPGAVGQIAAATVLSVAVAGGWGWGLGARLVLRSAVSVASTMVLLRALLDRNTLDSPAGRVARGWLIVEDLFTVQALVLLPAQAEAAAEEAIRPPAPGPLLPEVR